MGYARDLAVGLSCDILSKGRTSRTVVAAFTRLMSAFSRCQMAPATEKNVGLGGHKCRVREVLTAAVHQNSSSAHPTNRQHLKGMRVRKVISEKGPPKATGRGRVSLRAPSGPLKSLQKP